MCYSPLLSLYRHLFWSADCPKFGCWLLCRAGSAVPLACSHDSWESVFPFYAACCSGSSYKLFYSSPDTTFSKQPWVLYWLINTYTHNKTRKCVSVLISTSSKWEFCLFHILDNIWYCLCLFILAILLNICHCCFILLWLTVA